MKLRAAFDDVNQSDTVFSWGRALKQSAPNLNPLFGFYVTVHEKMAYIWTLKRGGVLVDRSQILQNHKIELSKDSW